MHTQENYNSVTSTRHDYSWGIGAALIAVGFILLLDQYLRTGWLNLLILPICGLILLGWGIATRKYGLLVPGSILTGLGIGEFIILSHVFAFGLFTRIGLFLVFFRKPWASGE